MAENWNKEFLLSICDFDPDGVGVKNNIIYIFETTIHDSIFLFRPNQVNLEKSLYEIFRFLIVESALPLSEIKNI